MEIGRKKKLPLQCDEVVGNKDVIVEPHKAKTRSIRMSGIDKLLYDNFIFLLPKSLFH
jgi:hypothetical protein